MSEFVAMRWATVVLGALLSILIVASPAAALRTVPMPSGPTVSVGIPLLTDAISLPALAPTRELPATTFLSLTLTLNNPRSGSIDRYLAQVENPHSTDYRHFLSYEQYVADFAPPVSATTSVANALARAGATDISSTPDRSSVGAVLSAASVERLLGVHLVSYGSTGRTPLYTAVGTVSLPASMNGLISGVGGLSNSASTAWTTASRAGSLSARPIPLDHGQFVQANGTGDWFLGSDYTQAYGATDLFPGNSSVADATYPTHVAIATLLASAFNATSQTNLPPWDPAVIDSYFNATLGPGWPMPNLTGVPVTVDGATPPLPGSFGSLNDSSTLEIENSLDLEMAGSLAPGASLYNFYFAGSLIAGLASVGDPADLIDADLAQALAYNYSPAHLATISCSFGLPDVDDAAWNAELLTAAATGITLLSASGDQGNAPDSLTGRDDGPWPVWPATAASNTSGSVSVGGVALSLSGVPNTFLNGSSLNLSYDPDAGAISKEYTWYDTSDGQGKIAGSEGGVSTVFPEPNWQFESAAQPAIVNTTLTQGATTIGRAGPDVAMPGNATLVTIYANSTGVVFLIPLEGTSIAAPVLAGLLADVVAVENNQTPGPWTSLGFIDPEIYQIASYFAQNPGASGDPFMDVTLGSNYVFLAAPGWDPTTGWGGVYAPTFLAADRNTTLLDYHYAGPTPGLPPVPPSTSGGSSVPWVYIFAIFGAGFLVAVALVIVTARPSSNARAPAVVPWGAQGVGSAPPPVLLGGTPPGTTFLCPYCGAIRPAEPVRCPRCGAF
ncbi:MAG: protease pro-enzyme activation domain-containing protein [Thermoplasmata archaeon]